MKKQIARILVAASIFTFCLAIMPGCALNCAKITQDTKIAGDFGLQRVSQSIRPTVANYYDVAAAGMRSINGTQSVQAVINQILSFIPQNVQQQYPQIPLALSGVITFAYQTYGQPGMNCAATGLEQSAAPYISPSPVPPTTGH